VDLRRQKDLIDAILNNIGKSTGANFENKVGYILTRYYTHKGKELSTHSSQGGDGGNDGWIKSEGIFHQMYAPRPKANESIKKSIHTKYANNLGKLLTGVTNGAWGGMINGYVFIVNTQDEGLPPDPDGNIDKITAELNQTHKLSLAHKLVNCDYIKTLLEEITCEEVLQRIVLDLNSAPIDLNKFNIETDGMVNFLEAFLDCIASYDYSDSSDSSKIWIPIAKKIEINNLVMIKQQIFTIQSKLNIVEDAIKILDDPLPRFDRIVSFFTNAYNESIHSELEGIDAYNSIVDTLVGLCDDTYEFHIEYILVYIIERCDIFKTS